MLQLKQLTKLYPQSAKNIEIFKDLDFQVKKGKKIAIMGKSGSGKSTLLSLMSGIIKPTSGDVLLDSISYNSIKESELNDFRAENIGFVFQNFHLITYLNALENVMLPARIKGIKNPREKATELLNSVGLSHRLSHLPSQLSGGEKQRVAIARALITHPKIILADEPSGNLDEQTGIAVMDMFFELIDKHNMTLVLVTHSKDVANRCEKIYELKSGKLNLC